MQVLRPPEGVGYVTDVQEVRDLDGKLISWTAHLWGESCGGDQTEKWVRCPVLVGEPITFHYTNYRGECRMRRAVPRRLAFERTEWHPEPQWILYAFDVEKGAERGFALRDCEFTRI